MTQNVVNKYILTFTNGSAQYEITKMNPNDVHSFINNQQTI